MRTCSILILAVTLATAPRLARADTAKTGGARHTSKRLAKTESAATPTTPWDAAYADARADMLAGRFASAVQKFEALLLATPDASSRVLVAELLAACRTWAQGGFVLTTPTHLALPEPMANRRTLDELAILYTNAVLNGIYAGMVIDLRADPDSAAGWILPPLGLAAAAAGIVALIDYTAGFGYGVAQSTVSGMYIGFEEALVWMLWHEARSPSSNEWGRRPWQP
jgi:hypothetical protein